MALIKGMGNSPIQSLPGSPEVKLPEAGTPQPSTPAQAQGAEHAHLDQSGIAAERKADQTVEASFRKLELESKLDNGKQGQKVIEDLNVKYT